MRGAATREISGTLMHSSASTPGSFALPTPPVKSAGVNASEDTAIPGASVESSPSVSEKDEADGSLSPKL